jgi:hypothetical protein
VKFLLPLVLFAALALSACNTLTNRRAMYWNHKVYGPYSQQLADGSWGRRKTVDQQYAETQARKRHPKIIPGEKKPVPSSTGGRIVPESSPDAALPN